ncbi:hypothetical protein [Tenacibaculum ovolyticum]|jgi:hypothetical protein|uniref:hypothetical protein n=1 Tax=Tenacibaculum ovolyticum TaxID=104270 RepID=UPI0003FB61D9|nr:hypothetical protein [Tenacibaculum ovolyticum]
MQIVESFTESLTGKRLIGISKQENSIELLFDLETTILEARIILENVFYFNSTIGVKQTGDDIVESYTLNSLEDSYFKEYPDLAAYRESKAKSGFLKIYYAKDELEVIAGFDTASFSFLNKKAAELAGIQDFRTI